MNMDIYNCIEKAENCYTAGKSAEMKAARQHQAATVRSNIVHHSARDRDEFHWYSGQGSERRTHVKYLGLGCSVRTYIAFVGKVEVEVEEEEYPHR